MKHTKFSGNAVKAALNVLDGQEPTRVKFLFWTREVPVKNGWVPMRKALDAAMAVLETETA